jgi:N-carbamoyl-L-amino-acid hydrolase
MGPFEQKLREATADAMPLAQSLFDSLARDTADPAGGVTRASYGEGEQRAHALLARVARDLDLEVTTDAGGNLYMTLPGRDRAAPAWFVGSHLDSVPKGGNFDGAAGVIAGIAAIRALKLAAITPMRDITVMGIRAEETGSWFSGPHGGHLGSRMALGSIRAEEFDQAIRVDSGCSLGEHMRDCGLDPDAARANPPHLDRTRIKGYLELHIEQGPVLEHRGIPVGVVTGIRGNSRLRDARCLGEYNHGGATPQDLRCDAVIATSELVLAVDRKWQELDAAGRDLVFTFGKLYTDPKMHSLSKVPGEARFSLDLRSAEPEVLATMRELVPAAAAEIAARRKVRFELGAFSVMAPTVLDSTLRHELKAGCGALELPAIDLASGGGHDAQDFMQAGIPAAMIFVRNANGSHVAEESMTMADFELGTRLLAWQLTRDA